MFLLFTQDMKQILLDEIFIYLYRTVKACWHILHVILINWCISTLCLISCFVSLAVCVIMTNFFSPIELEIEILMKTVSEIVKLLIDAHHRKADINLNK